MLQQLIFFPNKTFHQRILKKNHGFFPQKYEEAQLFTTLIIVKAMFLWAENHYIQIISEGLLCD